MGVEMVGLKNRSLWLLILALAASLALAGCLGADQGRKKDSDPAGEAAREDKEPVSEIQIQFSSTSDVNWENDKPHPVVVCFYQLQSPGAITSRAGGEEGISELLACRQIDASVLSYERLTLQPSQQKSRTLQRMPGANYIGVAAGYYNYARGRSATTFEIDNTAVTVILGKNGLTIKKTGEERPLN
jgi:type VI secretion system VasD/TssJ family lipoprotein